MKPEPIIVDTPATGRGCGRIAGEAACQAAAKRGRAGRLIHGVALVALVAAYAGGHAFKEKDVVALLESRLAGQRLVKGEGFPPSYEIRDADSGKAQGTLVVTSTQGWGGPVQVAVAIRPAPPGDPSGAASPPGTRPEEAPVTLSQVMVIRHTETPSFFRSLLNAGFFAQFAGMDITAPFEPDGDVDTVSGATISSRAVTQAVRQGAHWAATAKYGRSVKEEKPTWRFGTNEWLLAGFFLAVWLGTRFKRRAFRYALLGFGVVFLGFQTKSPLSLATLSSLFMGYVPSVRDNPFWWMLLAGVFLLILIGGKNSYCSSMCPCGALQEGIARVGGIRFRLSRRLIRSATWTARFLLWLGLVIMFLTRNSGIGTFEPFGTLFSFKGSPVQWYLLLSVVAGSFVMPRFWCRFFCPVGVFLNETVKLRNGVRRKRRTPSGAKPERAPDTRPQGMRSRDRSNRVESGVATAMLFVTFALILAYFTENLR